MNENNNFTEVYITQEDMKRKFCNFYYDECHSLKREFPSIKEGSIKDGPYFMWKNEFLWLGQSGHLKERIIIYIMYILRNNSEIVPELLITADLFDILNSKFPDCFGEKIFNRSLGLCELRLPGFEKYGSVPFSTAFLIRKFNDILAHPYGNRTLECNFDYSDDRYRIERSAANNPGQEFVQSVKSGINNNPSRTWQRFDNVHDNGFDNIPDYGRRNISENGDDDNRGNVVFERKKERTKDEMIAEEARRYGITYLPESANRTCLSVVLSDRAYRAIIAETAEFSPAETGGVMIGNLDSGIWYVVDCLDPGFSTVNNYAYFNYQMEYVNHLFKKTGRLYENPLTIEGIWHRHPGKMDYFSSTDYDSIRKLVMNDSTFGMVFMLVTVAPEFEMTFYYVDKQLRMFKVPFAVGDKYVVDDFLRLKSPEKLFRPEGPNSRLKKLQEAPENLFPSSLEELREKYNK